MLDPLSAKFALSSRKNDDLIVFVMPERCVLFYDGETLKTFLKHYLSF